MPRVFLCFVIKKRKKGKNSSVDKLFSSNIEDKEVYFKQNADTENVRDLDAIFDICDTDKKRSASEKGND